MREKLTLALKRVDILHRNSGKPQIAMSSQKLKSTPEVITPRFRQAIIITNTVQNAKY